MPSQVRIYDNGGKTIDRYTLVVPSVNTPGMLDMYGFNDNPYHPQGFGQYAGEYRQMSSYSHLGKLVSLDSLPDDARRFVKDTLTEPLPDGYGISLSKVRGGAKKPSAKRKSGKRSSAPTSVRWLR